MPQTIQDLVNQFKKNVNKYKNYINVVYEEITEYTFMRNLDDLIGNIEDNRNSNSILQTIHSKLNKELYEITAKIEQAIIGIIKAVEPNSQSEWRLATDKIIQEHMATKLPMLITPSTQLLRNIYNIPNLSKEQSLKTLDACLEGLAKNVKTSNEFLLQLETMPHNTILYELKTLKNLNIFFNKDQIIHIKNNIKARVKENNCREGLQEKLKHLNYSLTAWYYLQRNRNTVIIKKQRNQSRSELPPLHPKAPIARRKKRPRAESLNTIGIKIKRAKIKRNVKPKSESRFLALT